MRIVPPKPITVVDSNIAEELPLSAAGVSYPLYNASTVYSLTPYGAGNPNWFVSPLICIDYSPYGGPPVFSIWQLIAIAPASPAPTSFQNIAPGPSAYSDIDDLSRFGSLFWNPVLAYPLWDSVRNFGKGALIGHISGPANARVGIVYQSLADNNVGFDPIATPTKWQPVGTTYEIWSNATTYASQQRVAKFSGTRGKIYESRAGSNVAHDPEVATNSAWWKYIGEAFKAFDHTVTYDNFDIVTGDSGKRLYQSLIASNKNPLSDTTKWQDIGASNRHAMFDPYGLRPSRFQDVIDTTFEVTGFIDTVALLKTSASSVQLIAYNADGVKVYDQTKDLVADLGVNSLKAFLFEPIRRRESVLFEGLPAYPKLRIRAIISNQGQTVSSGMLLCGQALTCGVTLQGANLRLVSYSNIDPDKFGIFKPVKRPNARAPDWKVLIEHAKIDVDYVDRIMAEIEAVPVLFIGTDKYASCMVFGVLKRADITISYESFSYMDVSMIGFPFQDQGILAAA